jgi:hypothetical protein
MFALFGRFFYSIYSTIQCFDIACNVHSFPVTRQKTFRQKACTVMNKPIGILTDATTATAAKTETPRVCAGVCAGVCARVCARVCAHRGLAAAICLGCG